ncbi:MAG: hypothetical protein FWE95_09805 [Planctomycetaceae bacterium]|nr:hypothetical protein [Planctomycetaceae bacterium]
MLRKRKTTEIELGGQDSFLDLVSNIVGILLILVMVAGVRAQYSSANVPDPLMLADLETKFEEMQLKEERAIKLQDNVEDLLLQSEIVAEQLQRQSLEYSALFDFMIAAQVEMKLAAEEKDQTFKEKIEFQRQLLETNARLEQLDRERSYYQQIRPQATVMDNIPTPMSKTVGEDKEIHVRLLGGKIVYVPLMELILQMRREVSEDLNRYARQQTSVARVGPIDCFEMECLLVSYQIPVSGTRLQYAEVKPQFEPMGQPLREALASPQSEFRRKLSMFRRDIYTVTVWVYPDSFEEYQKLKRFLHELGYQVAARPMGMGESISVSPYGRRSTTQ